MVQHRQATSEKGKGKMTKGRGRKKLSVVLAESMNANDIYKGWLEGEAIVRILKLLDVEATYRTVVDRKRLSKALTEASQGGFSVFHLSCHANKDGFDLTSDSDISWAELAILAQDRLQDTALCLSACEAGNIAVAKEFQQQEFPPSYIVGPQTEPGYAQACVAWSVFYHSLAKQGIKKEHMKSALDRMNQAVDSDFLYRRWDGKKYLRYPSA